MDVALEVALEVMLVVAVVDADDGREVSVVVTDDVAVV